jgi:hypothetical protein
LDLGIRAHWSPKHFHIVRFSEIVGLYPLRDNTRKSINMGDEEAQTNGDTSLDLLQVRQTLLSNSTKQRVAELSNIHEALKREGSSSRV